MQLKKIAGILLVLTGVFFFSDQIKAAAMSAYTPLVSIPGVGSPKNISQYLVGLYNFLLSIVGIVAVLMFIIGGFKYLTAAGNPSAATDAKDTIYNAAYGLILAIMSWVIVSTINPDVLVIKKPGGMTTGTWNPVCTTSDATVGPPASCDCVDGTTTLASAVGSCDTDCKTAGKCIADKITCIANGSSNSGDANGKCTCIDGYKTSKTTSTCETTCSQPANYHCLKAVMVALVTKDLPYELWGQNSRSYDNPEDPLIIPDNTWIAWNGLNYSFNYPTYPGLTPPIQYCFDGLPSPATSNGACDLASEGGSANARAAGNILYSDFVGKSNCTGIINPASIQCKFNYIIQDSGAPESSSTNLYIRILKP